MKNKIWLLSIVFALFLGCKDIKDQVRNTDAVIRSEDVKHFKDELESLNEKSSIAVFVADNNYSLSQHP